MTHRVGVRAAMYVGGRTVLAMTCRGCGRLRPGADFGRRTCNNGHYIDRRCRSRCRWRRMEASPGRGNHAAPTDSYYSAY